MGLSGAALPDDQDVGAWLDPGVAGGERHDVGFADRGRDDEVEGLERLAGSKAGLRHMTGDAPGRALGEFVLTQDGEEARRATAFLVGGRAQFLPEARWSGILSSVSMRGSLAASVIGESCGVRCVRVDGRRAPDWVEEW